MGVRCGAALRRPTLRQAGDKEQMTTEREKPMIAFSQWHHFYVAPQNVLGSCESVHGLSQSLPGIPTILYVHIVCPLGASSTKDNGQEGGA